MQSCALLPRPGYAGNLVRDDAVAFIANATRDDAPFFLYLPFQECHSPFQVTQNYSDLCELPLLPSCSSEAGKPLTTERSDVRSRPASAGRAAAHPARHGHPHGRDDRRRDRGAEVARPVGRPAHPLLGGCESSCSLCTGDVSMASRLDAVSSLAFF